MTLEGRDMMSTEMRGLSLLVEYGVPFVVYLFCYHWIPVLVCAHTVLCLKVEDVHDVADNLNNPLQNHQSRQDDVSGVLFIQTLKQFLFDAYQPYCHCSKSHPARRTTMLGRVRNDYVNWL